MLRRGKEVSTDYHGLEPRPTALLRDLLGLMTGFVSSFLFSSIFSVLL